MSLDGAWGTLLLALATALPARAQAGASGCRVEVRGDVPRPLTLGAEALDRLPRRGLTTEGRDGAPIVYEGVGLADVLQATGVEWNLRGAGLLQYVVASGADGYRVVLALAEVDSTISGRRILIADRRDGAALSPEEGPCRLLVEGQRRGARSVRQLILLEVRRAD